MAVAQSPQVLKVVVLGESSVGKTSLIGRFVNQVFTDRYQTTISSDIHRKKISIDNQPYLLEIWDTAGCERFHSLSVGFYRGAMCCVLVYDVTTPSSFQMLQSWRDNFLLAVGPRQPDKFPFVVVGNKIDMPYRSVTARRAENWCAAHGDLPYFESSARESTNVDLLFQTAARSALQQLGPMPDKQPEVIRITRRPSQQTKDDLANGVNGQNNGSTDASSSTSSRCC